MANLKAALTRPKVSEHYARNPFDRSYSVNTSYQLGGLEPFFAQPFIAGSHVKLNRAIFQRTADVNTAAFPKVDTHVEFFVVPIRLLWAYWNNFKLNIQDFNSANFGSLNSTSMDFTAYTPSLSYLDIHEVLRQLNNDRFQSSALTPSTYFNYANTASSSAQSATVGAMRVLAGLGYGQYPFADMSSYDSTGLPFHVNPLKLLAYQKVYYDHFRNTSYEPNDPSAYNIDDLATSVKIPDKRLGKLMRYHYVNYRKDYFQSVYPSLNYVVSNPTGQTWTLPDTLVGRFGVGSTTNNTLPYTSGPGDVLVPTQVGQTYNGFTSVQSIRAAFALDKLLRASAFTPKHVKDQFEARYGVKGVESGNESVRIAAFMNDIVIQEVVNQTATNSSGFSGLGQIGGKGIGFNGFGKDVEFTCKEDSIILGVVYSLPRSSYDGTFVENWNAKLDREDFFIPEYMDLGMQPLLGHEMSILKRNNSNVLTPNWSSAAGLYAYKDRYSEYKVGIDRNLGNFIEEGVLTDFVVHSNGQWFTASGNSAINANYFKVKPNDMDSVFAQNTDTTDITTDKFITHIDVRCICNQNISVHGQPRNGGLG